MANPLAMKEEDLKLLLAAEAHLGTKNLDPNMERYVWKRRSDGACACRCRSRGLFSVTYSLCASPLLPWRVDYVRQVCI